MLDCVSYFVVVRYRDSKLTERVRCSSYDEAMLFVNCIVYSNKLEFAVMPIEVKLEFIPELPN